MLVSIVIITRNRTEILNDCLQHLLQGDVRSEIVVVDASDDDQTHFLMRKYPQVCYVRLLDGANQMPRSRNEGLKRTSGDVVAFIDDDSLVQDGWLQALASHYENPSVGGVGGMVLAPAEEVSEVGAVGGLSALGTPNGTFNIQTPGPIAVEHLRGCNMSFRRQVLERVGGFDPRYDGSNFREETDMCVRVRRAGYTIVYDPAATVIHLFARKEGFGRDAAVDPDYRFSVAKNSAYFRLKHFLNVPTLLSVLLVGPARLIGQLLLRRSDPNLVWADLSGRWAGLRTYLNYLWERQGE